MKVSLEIPQLVEVLDAIKGMQAALNTLQESLATPQGCGQACSCISSGTSTPVEVAISAGSMVSTSNPPSADAQPEPEEKPKRARKPRAKKAETTPEPKTDGITIAELRAAMNARAAESAETRAAIIAIAREYHPMGKMVEVDPSKYAEVLVKVQSA